MAKPVAKFKKDKEYKSTGWAGGWFDDAEGEVFAMIAEFDDVPSVVAAAEKVRDAGYDRWDVHSPIPIHGIEKALDMKPTILPWLVLGGGLAGLAGGLKLTFWANAITMPHVPTVLQGYEYLISGKPIWSLPANIPIMFETTVLLSAFAAVLGMLALNKLPMHYNPLFKSDRFRRVTSDRFFIVIEAESSMYDDKHTERLLRAAGATYIERVLE